MTAALTVVFDANVLFGARLRSLLMELAMSGLFRARWSEHIHAEWMTAVSEKRGISVELLLPTRLAMDDAVPDALVMGYESLIAGLTLPDENDRHVLAAATSCGANVIVTFNQSDFPAAVLAGYGIRTCHPDDFILEIEAASPGVLAEAANADFRHYQNPPLTFEVYVEGLRAAGVVNAAEYLAKLHGLNVV